MAHLDWILVAFGAVVALSGGWIQLQPERIYPRPEQPWLDQVALSQLRRLGGCFLFMGVFFTLQMTVDLARLPWWSGTLGGLILSIAAVSLVQTAVRRQQNHGHRVVQQGPMPEKVLELSRRTSRRPVTLSAAAQWQAALRQLAAPRDR
jgi:hypothetical protein